VCHQIFSQRLSRRKDALIAALAYTMLPILFFIEASIKTKELIEDAYNEIWSTTNLTLNMANCGAFAERTINCYIAKTLEVQQVWFNMDHSKSSKSFAMLEILEFDDNNSMDDYVSVRTASRLTDNHIPPYKAKLYADATIWSEGGISKSKDI
jgi:hypothetical protein